MVGEFFQLSAIKAGGMRGGPARSDSILRFLSATSGLIMLPI
jgi:hypothetical protein